MTPHLLVNENNRDRGGSNPVWYRQITTGLFVREGERERERASSRLWDICDLHSSERSHPPPSSHLLYSAFRLCYENPACRGSRQKQTPPPPTDFWTVGSYKHFLHNLSKLQSGGRWSTEEPEDLASQVSSGRCNLQYCLAGHWTGRQYNEWDLCPKWNGLKRLITFTWDLSLKLVGELLAQ